MFCKRMHLTERRYKPPPEIKEGPITRPCTLRNDLIDGESRSPRLKRLVFVSFCMFFGSHIILCLRLLIAMSYDILLLASER